jgi:hypothetical protein
MFDDKLGRLKLFR